MVISALMAHSRRNSHWHRGVCDIAKSTRHFTKARLSSRAVSFPPRLGEMHQHQHSPKARFPKGNGSRQWLDIKPLCFPVHDPIFHLLPQCVNAGMCPFLPANNQNLEPQQLLSSVFGSGEWCTSHQHLSPKQTENCGFNSTVYHYDHAEKHGKQWE